MRIEIAMDDAFTVAALLEAEGEAEAMSTATMASLATDPLTTTEA